MSKSRIPEEQGSEVFALAAQLYTQKSQEQGYSLEELVQAGTEAQISPECLEAALLYIQTANLQFQPSPQTTERRKKMWAGAIATSMALMGWLTWTYHTLTSATQDVDRTWHQVENQLQHHTELIPDLIDTIQASAQPERELAALLAQSRQSYLAANTRIEKIQAANDLIKALNKFQHHAGQNLQLRSHVSSKLLQSELLGSEYQLAARQKQYNHRVKLYNQQVQSLPGSLVAPVLGFEPKPVFAAEGKIPVAMP